MPFCFSVPSPTTIRMSGLGVCVCGCMCGGKCLCLKLAWAWQPKINSTRKTTFLTKTCLKIRHIYHTVKQVPGSARQSQIRSGKWFLDAALSLPSQRRPRRWPWTINQVLITTPPPLPPTFPTPSQWNNSYCHSRADKVPATASLFFSQQMWC